MRTVDVPRILMLASTIASELAAVAFDRSNDLTAAERKALVALSLGLESAAERATAVLPRSAFATQLLLRSMLASLPPGNDNATLPQDCE